MFATFAHSVASSAENTKHYAQQTTHDNLQLWDWVNFAEKLPTISLIFGNFYKKNWAFAYIFSRDQ